MRHDQKLIFLLNNSFLFGRNHSSTGICQTSDLFKRTDGNYRAGQLKIIQDHAIDTLITRYILAINENFDRDTGDMAWKDSGSRFIQFNRNAREESNQEQEQNSISKFPDIKFISVIC